MRFTDENNNISVKDIRIKGDKEAKEAIERFVGEE